MSKSIVKIIFFGTSDFALPALEALKNEGYDIVAVVTAPDKPVGRKQILTPPPIKVAAQKLGLPVLQPKKLKNLNPETWTLKPDLGIVAAYGKLIPPEIFNLPEYGTLNIHPSLLPKYRGPSPIQTAILNGDTETGVTIMKVDEDMDHGDIVATGNWQLAIGNAYQEIHDQLAKFGAELLIKTLPDYLAGKIKPRPQDHTRATYTHKFNTEDGEIKSDDTVETASSKIRALNPEPGTYYWIYQDKKKSRLKILEAQLPSNLETRLTDENHGKLSMINNFPALQLKNGYIILKTVQLEGKRPVSGQDFARRYFK
ncbi:MAG: methionyl-tRNA formyltransferase [Candidatus Yanofskybacteria bacterium]|nr:methionyl-tRNA formyltransferase [Candidatus Yanofskybacteria bacterium]